MNDYNFFDDYKVKKVPKSKSYRFVNILFLGVLIVVASYVAFNYYILNQMVAEIKQVDDQLLVLKTSKDYIRLLEKEGTLNEIEALAMAVEEAGEDISVSSLIDENLLAIIADTMPSDVALSSYVIVDDTISLSGVALSKPAIAEYEYQLRNLGMIKDVFVNGISTDSGEAVEGLTQTSNYTFTMNLTIGGDSHADQ